jgi:hypothetical protein
VIPVPANLDFGFDATVNELLYDKLTMRDARGRLRVKDQRITLENFTFNTLGGGFAVNGFYDTKDLAKPAFDVGLKIQKLDIPKAFEAFTTVQMLAPVAKYATGTFSTELKLNGLLGKDMMPVFPSLKGAGGVQTSILRLQDFPPAGQGGEHDQALAARESRPQGGALAVRHQGRTPPRCSRSTWASGRLRCASPAPTGSTSRWTTI